MSRSTNARQTPDELAAEQAMEAEELVIRIAQRMNRAYESADRETVKRLWRALVRVERAEQERERTPVVNGEADCCPATSENESRYLADDTRASSAILEAADDDRR